MLLLVRSIIISGRADRDWRECSGVGSFNEIQYGAMLQCSVVLGVRNAHKSEYRSITFLDGTISMSFTLKSIAACI